MIGWHNDSNKYLDKARKLRKSDKVSLGDHPEVNKFIKSFKCNNP